MARYTFQIWIYAGHIATVQPPRRSPAISAQISAQQPVWYHQLKAVPYDDIHLPKEAPAAGVKAQEQVSIVQVRVRAPTRPSPHLVHCSYVAPRRVRASKNLAQLQTNECPSTFVKVATTSLGPRQHTAGNFCSLGCHTDFKIILDSCQMTVKWSLCYVTSYNQI